MWIICAFVRCQSEDHPISIPTWHDAIEFIYLRPHQHHKRYCCNTDVHYTSALIQEQLYIKQVGIAARVWASVWTSTVWRGLVIWRSITDAHGSLTERTSNQPMKLRVLKPIVIPPIKLYPTLSINVHQLSFITFADNKCQKCTPYAPVISCNLNALSFHSSLCLVGPRNKEPGSRRLMQWQSLAYGWNLCRPPAVPHWAVLIYVPKVLIDFHLIPKYQIILNRKERGCNIKIAPVQLVSLRDIPWWPVAWS